MTDELKLSAFIQKRRFWGTTFFQVRCCNFLLDRQSELETHWICEPSLALLHSVQYKGRRSNWGTWMVEETEDAKMRQPCNIQVLVVWVVTPCNDVLGYWRFGELSCLHLQLKVEALHLEDETSVSYLITTRSQNPDHHDLNLHRRQSLKSRTDTWSPSCLHVNTVTSQHEFVSIISKWQREKRVSHGGTERPKDAAHRMTRNKAHMWNTSVSTRQVFVYNHILE